MFRFRLILITTVISLLIIGASSTAFRSIAFGQGSKATPTSAPSSDLIIPDDLMETAEHGNYRSFTGPSLDYKVIPIIFVPNDLSPNQHALEFVNRQMQMIRRWYGEQLRDRTFDL